MILEVLAFVSLAAVLLIKYVTTSHMTALRSELGELALEHRRCRGRKALIQERIADAISQEHDLQNVIRPLEQQLDELQREVMDMESRNGDLQEQIDEIW